MYGNIERSDNPNNYYSAHIVCSMGTSSNRAYLLLTKATQFVKCSSRCREIIYPHSPIVFNLASIISIYNISNYITLPSPLSFASRTFRTFRTSRTFIFYTNPLHFVAIKRMTKTMATTVPNSIAVFLYSLSSKYCWAIPTVQ